MTDKDLKPCPFCGSEPFIRDDNGVCCENMECGGEQVVDQYPHPDIDFDPIKAWNTRAPDLENKRLREALENIRHYIHTTPCIECSEYMDVIASQALKGGE